MLVIRWYDFICFAIVAGAVLTALWMIWRKEGAKKWDDNTMFASLVDGNDKKESHTTKLGYLSSSQLWSSCWRGVHPIWLLGTRFVSLVVMTGFQIWDVVDWNTSIYVYYTEVFTLLFLGFVLYQIVALNGAFAFYFYTQWTCTLVIVYFALGTIASAHGCWVYSSKRPSENGETGPLLKRDLEENRSTYNGIVQAKDNRSTIISQSMSAHDAAVERAGILGYLMQIIYQTCGGAVILMDIVFWCVIVPFLSDVHLGLNLLMGCMHSLNIFFLLLDALLNNLPFPWFRISYFILWSSIYVTFQWIMHACGFSWWPYPFLDLSSPWAPLWYFCLAIMHIPCYGMFALLTKAKDSLFSKWFPRAFVGSY